MENIKLDLLTALPEITVLCMAMVILIADLFLSKKNRLVIYVLAQITLFTAAYLVLANHSNSVSYAFNTMFVHDALSDVLKLMTLVGVAIMLVYTRHYMQLRGLFGVG